MCCWPTSQIWPSWKKLIVKFGHDVFKQYDYFDDVFLGDLA